LGRLKIDLRFRNSRQLSVSRVLFDFDEARSRNRNLRKSEGPSATLLL
jgi:hypothetical protein